MLALTLISRSLGLRRAQRRMATSASPCFARTYMHVRRGEYKRRTQTDDSSAFISISHIPTCRGISLRSWATPLGGQHIRARLFEKESRGQDRESQGEIAFIASETSVFISKTSRFFCVTARRSASMTFCHVTVRPPVSTQSQIP